MQPVRSDRAGSFVHIDTSSGMRDLPDLRGLSARHALRILTKIGLTARLKGSGVVTTQSPPPGTPIERGMACELGLERRLAAVASSAVEP
jgi:hypothetical protein